MSVQPVFQAGEKRIQTAYLAVGRKRILRLLLLGGIFLLLLVLAGGVDALAAPLAKWLRVTQSVSQSPQVISESPSLVVQEGQVVVVWSEGVTGDTCSNDRLGPIRLRVASEPSGWGGIQEISGSYIAQILVSASPAVAADDVISDVLHIVWVSGHCQTNAPPANMSQVRYITYTISSGAWGTPQIIADQSDADFSSPTLAVVNGAPHVIWQRTSRPDPYTVKREIFYSRLSGGSWSAPVKISGDDEAIEPTLTASQNYLHVAWIWEEKEVTTTYYHVRYSRMDLTQGIWEAPRYVFQDSENPCHNPSLVTVGQDVYLVWDWLHNSDNKLFYLVLNRSTNEGTSWVWGGDVKWTVPDLATYYKSSGVGYQENLQPILSLMPAGKPQLTWQHERDDGVYEILYSQMITPSTSAWTPPTWSPPVTFTLGSRDAVNGHVAVAQDGSLHVIFQGQVGDTYWDIFYTSDEEYEQVFLPLIMKQAQ